MSAARELARTLGGRKAGAGYVARCPAHDDHNPSLSFRDGERGVLLLKCFAGCDRRDVLAALRHLHIRSGAIDRSGRMQPLTQSLDLLDRKRRQQ